MNKFKIKLPKIILTIILISVLVFNIMTTKSYSASVIVETDSKTINNNYEFNYKLNFGETIVTTDFILEFDANYVEFLGVDTENTDYNQLGNGKFIILYVDEDGNGTRNIDIHLKAKIGNFDENTKTEIKVTDINAYALNRGASYSTEDFNLSNTSMFVSKYVPDNKPNDEENDNSNVGNVDDNKNQDNNGGQVIINNYYYGYDYNTGSINNNGNNNNNNNNNSNNNSGSQNNNNNSNDKDKYVVYDVGSVNNYNNNNSDKNKDSTYLGTIQITTPEQVDEESGDMPFTGTKSSTLATVLLIILIIHTIYVFFKAHNNKMNYYIVFALGIILLGTLDTYAVGNIFIKNFDRIKNYENLIVIMPDLDNRNIKKSDFVAIQESNNLKVVKVMDKESDIIGNNDLISTGHIAYSDDKVYHNILVYGDVNGDGNVNSSDIAEIIVNQKNNVELNGLVRKAANVYNKDDLEDKVIDNEDIYVLKQYTLRTLSGSLVKNLPEELPRGISIVYNRPEMEVNDQQQLSIEVIPNNMSVDDIVWTSNNEKILTVDENGKVTATGSGTAYITAMSKSDSVLNDTISIKVADVVTGVRMQLKQIQVDVGDTRWLGATVEPSTAIRRNVLWSTSNASIVSVDEYGRITANSEGKATIKVTTEQGRYTDTCEVLVYENDLIGGAAEKKVTGIVISKSSLNMKKGQKEKLDASVVPETATFQGISWISSNTDVATVDQKGNVKAVSSGIAVITAKSEDGGYTATCVVTVDKVSVTSVSLNKTSLKLENGESETLVATVKPYDATNQDIIWSTTNPSIATVVDGVVTGRGTGITTVFAKTQDGGHMAMCTVEVKPIRVTGIELERDDISVYVDKTVNLKATVYPNNADDTKIFWESDNEKIFTVDNFGNITGVREGKAKLTATTNDGNYKATCNVTVVKETINIENISLNTNKLTVKEGQSENLITTIEPTNATNQEVTWTSSNTDVVDVDTNGKILAKKEGVSVITVRTKDGYKEAKCEVTVTKISRPVTGLTLSETSLILNEKDTYNLVATVLPVDADNRSVKWMSMDTKVAEVDSNGKITAKAAGNTTIIVTTVEGGIIKTCNVKVNKVTKPVTGVILNETSITLEKDNKVNLLVNIEPFDADNQEVKWTSSNHSVATVNSNGEVTARGVGNTTITVTTVDGRYTATCEVIVIEQEEPPIEQPIEVTEVTLDKTSLELELNDTDTLIATVYPENADNKNVVWSSNNQSIVSVNETGELKAMGPGTAIITVTTENNEKTAFCTVTVKESSGPSVIPVSYVAINESLLNLRIGETGNLIATVYPEDATNKNVIWSSSRESVATVDQDGKVTAISSGTAYITVTTVDGNHISTCRATVAELPIIEPETNVELNKANMELEIGEESELSVIVTPDNQYEASFECNDANTVELKKQDNKMFIVGKKAGTVTIVVKITVDGKEYVRECIVTVKGDNSEVQEEVKVSIDKTELKLHAGESSDITINVTPSKPMQYSVSNINPKVVECKLENGIITVTGVDEGTTELHIKVIVDDKEYDFGCNVIVEKTTILNSLKKLFRLK